MFNLLDQGEPTTEELSSILAESRLLTVPGGPVELPKQIRLCVALFDSGIMLVQREFKFNAAVLSMEASVQKLGYRIKQKRLVGLSTMQSLYKLHENRSDLVKNSSGKNNATPMQRTVRALLEECSARGASDLHVIVMRDKTTIRLRVDGVLRDFREYSTEFGQELCASAFAAAEISDASYSPLQYQAAQISDADGKLPDNLQAVRMQFAPLAAQGRYMVIRLLDKGQAGDINRDLAGLGFEPYHLDMLADMRANPSGINLISGPTGSGKTTTLARLLTNLMVETAFEKNLLTVEDPVEVRIPGAEQIPITNANTPEERALKFQQALNAALRLDPDYIMCSEIRDTQSAKLAFQASMTGHGVYSTIHSNSALANVSRLRDIGMEDYKVSDPTLLTGLVAQRLLPKLCPNCRVPMSEVRPGLRIPGAAIDRVRARFGDLSDRIFFSGPGCERCDKSGQIGRTVVAEMIIPNNDFMNAVKKQDMVQAHEIWVSDMKGLTMKDHAEHKLLTGLICPAAAERSLGLLDKGLYSPKKFTL